MHLYGKVHHTMQSIGGPWAGGKKGKGEEASVSSLVERKCEGNEGPISIVL